MDVKIIPDIKNNISKALIYLNQPFPFPQKRWLIVVVPTVWVFLLVYILEPLELVVIEEQYKLIVTIAISLMTALASAIVIYLFPLIFKKFFNPKQWTRAKFFFIGILISVMSVAPITLFVYLFYLSYGIKFFYSYFDRAPIWLSLGIFIGLVPTFILYWLTWRQEFSSQLSVSINPEVVSQPTLSIAQNEIEIISIPKSAKETLTFSYNNFIYAEAQGNYLTIHYIVNNEIARETLRLTLSQMMQACSKYENIMRCHRTFLVNISYVKEVKRKAQKHALILKEITEEIPVSKTYWNSIEKALGL